VFARAFTLIELMIALAIVAMLAGIVLPIGLSRLNADAFVQAQRQLEAAVGIGRAESQRTGALVKLIAADGGVTLFSHAHRPLEESTDTGRKRSTPGREFVLELPAGVRIEADPDTEADEGIAAGEDAPSPGSPAASSEQVPADLGVCVLMPDGTVVTSGPLVLVARDGKRARIDFNPWTGSLAFPPLPARLSADAAPREPSRARDSDAKPGLSSENVP